VRPRPRASLFGLAPCGVLPATSVTRSAVRSYRTFSPLPAFALGPLGSRATARQAQWASHSRLLREPAAPKLKAPKAPRAKAGGIFSVPLVRRVAPPGCYPAHCPGGVRTFLSRRRSPAPKARCRTPRARPDAGSGRLVRCGTLSVTGRESGVGSRESGVGSRESGVGSREERITPFLSVKRIVQPIQHRAHAVVDVNCGLAISSIQDAYTKCDFELRVQLAL